MMDATFLYLLFLVLMLALTTTGPPAAVLTTMIQVLNITVNEIIEPWHVISNNVAFWQV